MLDLANGDCPEEMAFNVGQRPLNDWVNEFPGYSCNIAAGPSEGLNMLRQQ